MPRRLHGAIQPAQAQPEHLAAVADAAGQLVELMAARGLGLVTGLRWPEGLERPAAFRQGEETRKVFRAGGGIDPPEIAIEAGQWLGKAGDRLDVDGHAGTAVLEEVEEPAEIGAAFPHRGPLRGDAAGRLPERSTSPSSPGS